MNAHQRRAHRRVILREVKRTTTMEGLMLLLRHKVGQRAGLRRFRTVEARSIEPFDWTAGMPSEVEHPGPYVPGSFFTVPSSIFKLTPELEGSMRPDNIFANVL